MQIRNRFLSFYDNYLKINWLIVLLLFFAIFAVIDIKLRFILLPPLFSKAHLFESEIYNLAIAYISSFVFYYIVVFLPERRNKRLHKNFIAGTINSLLISASHICYCIIKNNDETDYPYRRPSDTELNTIISRTSPSSSGHHILDLSQGYNPITLWEYICHHRLEVLNYSQSISLKIPLIDHRLTSMFTQLENSALFKLAYTTGPVFNSGQFGQLSIYIVEYFKELDQLSSYTARNYGSKSFDQLFVNDEETITEYKTSRESSE